MIGDRVIGQITFRSTENFNPYFYDPNIVSILQLKVRNGVTLTIKQNNLRFFANARAMKQSSLAMNPHPAKII